MLQSLLNACCYIDCSCYTRILLRVSLSILLRYYFNGVYNIHTSLIDGITTIRFSRDPKTWDTNDFWFTDENCAYFLFPVYGGVFDVMSDYIGEHTDVPFISSHKICITKCEGICYSEVFFFYLKKEFLNTQWLGITTSQI